MASEPFTNHWTSIDSADLNRDSGRSSAAVFSSQSLSGQCTDVNDPVRLDQLSPELVLNDNTRNHDDPSLKTWQPSAQDLFSPSTSVGSADNFGLSAADSDQQPTKMFDSRHDELEKQLLQLKLDSNSLKLQNKQLKDRCKHYKEVNEQIKSQMKTDAGSFYKTFQDSLIERIISAKHSKADISRRGGDEEELSMLQKEMQQLRERNAALQEELDNSLHDFNANNRKTDHEMLAFKEELSRIRQLFESCEKKRSNDLEKWREDQLKVIQLNRIPERLQKELEQAEECENSLKMEGSLRERLRVLEDCLRKEREDRATGLSKVEERLVVENAKLKISEKEAKRHLNHTANQMKLLEAKYVELKKNFEINCEEETLMESHHSHDVPAASKLVPSDIFGKILDWDHLRTADDKMTHEQRDILQKMTEMETVFTQRIQELLTEKNLIAAQLQNIRDINETLKAENQSLQTSRSTVHSSSSSVTSWMQSYQDQIEALNSELKAAIDQVDRLSESNGHANSLFKKLEEVAAFLERHLMEIDKRKTSSQMIPSRVTKQIPENETKREYTQVHERKKPVDEQKNSEYIELLIHIIKSKMAVNDTELVHFDESERLILEGAIEERDLQLLKLQLHCDELGTELDFAKKVISQQTNDNEKLLLQVEQLKSQLRQKNRIAESLSASEQDMQMELRAVKQRLASTSKELLQKEAEVKSVQLLTEVNKTDSDQMERRETARNRRNSFDAEKEVLDFEDKAALEKLSAKLIQLEYEKYGVEESLQKANATVEMLIRENAELKHLLQQFHQCLASERSMVCRLTYDKMAAQQQFFAAEEECDTMKHLKERLESEVSRQETNSLRLSALLQSLKQQTSLQLDARFSKVNGDLKRAMAELRRTKHLLAAREKDVLLLQDTVQLMLKYDEASSIR